MRISMRFGIAVAGWAAAVVLTIVGSLKPSVIDVVHLWQLLAVGIAGTATVSLVVVRAQVGVGSLHSVD